MKTIFEEMGGTYRQVGYYFIPNITLPDDGEYQIGKYGRMRRSYLKKYRKILDPLTNAKKLPKPAVVPAE
ncbi:TnpV protein [Ruthenibacterium lactatiformans]|uniref:TnpV protein n=1 Tax=Ruthenibacterium lactatiformans TaxID=1550024 RepID=UPI0039A2ACB3